MLDGVLEYLKVDATPSTRISASPVVVYKETGLSHLRYG